MVSWYEPDRAEMRPIAEIQRAEEEAAAEAKRSRQLLLLWKPLKKLSEKA